MQTYRRNGLNKVHTNICIFWEYIGGLMIQARMDKLNDINRIELGRKCMYIEKRPDTTIIQRAAMLRNQYVYDILCGRECCNPKCYKRKYVSKVPLLSSLDYASFLKKTVEFTLTDWKKQYQCDFICRKKLQKCKCGQVVYCSRKCQKTHWNIYNHRLNCTAKR